MNLAMRNWDNGDVAVSKWRRLGEDWLPALNEMMAFTSIFMLFIFPVLKVLKHSDCIDYYNLMAMEGYLITP